MRRSDREVKDAARIIDVISRCRCCRLGFYDVSGGEVYIVPLNFGYDETSDGLVLYFHGAKEGRKLDLIRQNPQVGFEMYTEYTLHPADVACDWSAGFQSVIGTGTAAIVTDNEEKRRGLDRIMLHTTGKNGWTYSEQMLSAVCVFKVTVNTLSCKEHE